MTVTLDILPHLKFIPTKELRVEKEDAKHLICFNGKLSKDQERFVLC